MYFSVDCGLTSFKIPVGGAINLTSPGYPRNYPDNVNCVYFVNVAEGYKLLTQFVDFDLEYGFDALRALDQEDRPDRSDRHIFTGVNVPRNLTSQTSYFIFQFLSDGGVNSRGFHLMLSSINVTGNIV